MRVALRAIAILFGIAALSSLVSTFIGDHSLLIQELGAFVAAAIATVLFESAAELLDVLYEIRDRIPERVANTVSSEATAVSPRDTQAQHPDLVQS
jgi:hypothetical protein